MHTTSMSSHAIRLAADGLHATSAGRLTRRSGGDTSSQAEAPVRDGDEDALRRRFARHLRHFPRTSETCS
jgi:hypothetical protein